VLSKGLQTLQDLENIPSHECLSCGAATTGLAVSTLKNTVTSDCRPWSEYANFFQCQSCGLVQKAATPYYLERVSDIYQSYVTYRLNGEAGPMAFSAEVPTSRADKIIDIFSSVSNSGFSTWLDIGTGSGVVLRSVSSHLSRSCFDDVRLFGQDVSDHERHSILAIPGVESFLCQDIDDIDMQFDVVSMVHVLEHMPDPNAIVQTLSRRLTKSGVLLVQVPNIQQNPYDLLVYDHVSHFSVSSLLHLLQRHFSNVVVPEEQIQKEITILASNHAEAFTSQCHRIRPTQCFTEEVNGLNKLLQAQTHDVGVFSTGPVGIYAAANLEHQRRHIRQRYPEIRFREPAINN
jgi:SAM-dependent methyltransferase